MASHCVRLSIALLALLYVTTFVKGSIDDTEAMFMILPLLFLTISRVNKMCIRDRLICDTLGCSVLLKGGHQLNDANDLLFQKGKEPVWFYGKRINNPNTHGTGCTLSSAIASNLAKGRDLEKMCIRDR